MSHSTLQAKICYNNQCYLAANMPLMCFHHMKNRCHKKVPDKHKNYASPSGVLISLHLHRLYCSVQPIAGIFFGITETINQQGTLEQTNSFFWQNYLLFVFNLNKKCVLYQFKIFVYENALMLSKKSCFFCKAQ